jgi:hypothetical protein
MVVEVRVSGEGEGDGVGGEDGVGGWWGPGSGLRPRPAPLRVCESIANDDAAIGPLAATHRATVRMRVAAVRSAAEAVAVLGSFTGWPTSRR